MKQFFTVVSFELVNYFKKKGYLISTILISLVFIIALSLPSFVNLSKLIPTLGQDNSITTEESDNVTDVTNGAIVIYDKNNVISDISLISPYFHGYSVETSLSKDQLTEMVNSGQAVAGFIVNSLTDYEYYLRNSHITDSNKYSFNAALSNIYRMEYASKEGIDFGKLNEVLNVQINSDTFILGKDSVSNYAYTYFLLFLLYMMVLLYGQLIAVAVTSEKSNRAVEILVTSTSSNSLIFGKVIGGAIASFAQVAIILTSALASYGINRNAWHGILDKFLQVPTNVLVAFALFGGFGYFLFAFMFGALGALVSKTEDIGTSAGPLMLIYVAAFMISIFGLANPTNLVLKIASYVPFTSPMAMFVRICMDTVPFWQYALSFGLLLVTTLLVALLASKIYRLGTLMYGNPIKLKNALKYLKKN